ncbi:MAG: hypothetical protein V8Q42_00320 [Anaerovoracaceae bacterium]
MDYYFSIISAIDIFVLGTMCVLTGLNETLNMKQRRWFISSFILIIVITALEVVTEFTDNGSASLRWISIVSNYLGFGRRRQWRSCWHQFSKTAVRDML